MLNFAMKLEQVIRTDVSYVELQKDEKILLGVSIRDGTPEEAGPVVKSIKQRSPAAKSFAVANGDIILSLNGCSTIGTKSSEITHMLKESEKTVNLELQYKTREARIAGCGVYRRQQITTRLQKVNGSFGFVLRKKDSRFSYCMEYPIVSNIKEGSLIHRSGQLQDGDRLLMVDDVNLSWMSLSSIATFLDERDEAEFTFEYNVRVVNLRERTKKLDLEIDVPVANLGIGMCMCDEDADKCTAIYIGSIRQGSIAERCGVFAEGDIILAINDVSTKDLTVSEADLLLRDPKKGRKISFIRNRRKEEIEIPIENSCYSTDDDSVTAESCYSSGSHSRSWKHVNTPAYSNFAPSIHQQNLQAFDHCQQLRTMDKLQSMVAIMTSLKQSLSTLTRDAFNAGESLLNRNCMTCNNAQHTVKLCTSCLAKTNVKCVESIATLRKIVVHFVRFSMNGADLQEKKSSRISLRKVIEALTETLPNTLRVPELKVCFEALADKMASADTSCFTCDFEVKSVMVIVQQLLLLISISDNSTEFTDLTEQLVSSLLEKKFSCDGDSEHMHSTSENTCSSSVSENVSSSASLSRRDDDELSVQSRVSRVRNNSEADSTDTHYSIPSNINLNTSVNHDHLRLTHIKIPSESENSVSVSTSSSSRAQSAPVIANQSSSADEILSESTSTPIPSENTSTSIPSENSSISIPSGDPTTSNRTNLRKTAGQKISRVWKSVDSFIRGRRSANVDDFAENSSQITSNRSNTTVSSAISERTPDMSLRNLQERLSPSSSVLNLGEAMSQSDDDSSQSSNGPSGNENGTNSVCAGTRKTHPETLKARLTNTGNGFGIDFNLSSTSADALPTITSVVPKSSAYRVGVLKVGDRILSINEKSTRNITKAQLHNMKKRAFASETMKLCVEFDVADEEYQFGTFDVTIGTTLKPGLIYEDLKKGSSVLVTGIAKGSSAHRSGQLFPRDEINYFRSTRIEEYDPVIGDFVKQERVILTVHRDPRRVMGLLDNSTTASPSSVNRRLHKDTVPRRGTNFVVNSTAVRSSGGVDSLVMEHDVTLFRDSTNCDFGMQVSENPGLAYVTDIRPNGPADNSGVIKKNDRILKIDGVLLDSSEENSALARLCLANQKLDLLIRRTYK